MTFAFSRIIETMNERFFIAANHEIANTLPRAFLRRGVTREHASARR
jgi:hypothetical protein